MRLIKFRAHSKTGPLWVYGYYKYIRCFDQHVIENENGVYDVDGDTVGQYWITVNNQELYDGDVFTVNGKYTKLVKWVEEYACFCIANISELELEWLSPWQQPASGWFNEFGREIIVIGNVHDMPELLNPATSNSEKGALCYIIADWAHPIAYTETPTIGPEEMIQPLVKCDRQMQTLTFTINKIHYNNSHYYLKKENRIDHPPYFSILGSNRALRKERTELPTKKVERNVRPKGTHTHCRFYR